jgi:hypothetical protein
VVAAALAAALTFLVYRPDRTLPFDFVDFSEFLPLLRRGGSFAEVMASLLDYYAGDQGRLNIVGYAGIALKWTLWEDSSPPWQFMRFATMWLVILLAYKLLRRLDASRLASAAGASIFLFAPPAVEGWTRLTMAEPLGTVLLLLACLMGLKRRPGPSEGVLATGFAITCATLVLLKEMMAATLLLPVALVALHARQTPAPWPLSRLRNLTAAVLVAVVVTGVPVAVVAIVAPAQAYAADFGATIRPLGNALAQWGFAFAPFGLATSFPPPLVGSALGAFLALLVAGWLLRLRPTDRDSSRSGRLLALALLFPLVGTVIYLPWPAYQRFYAIPYLIGGAILAALALTSLERRGRMVARSAYAVWVLFLAFAGADAAAQAGRMAVRQQINRAVVARVSANRQLADTVLLATEQRAPQAWQEIGPTLQRYGNALGDSMPILINTPCEESYRRAAAGTAAVVFYSSLCPGVTTADPVVMRYRRLKLPALRPVPDSIRVDFVLPGPSQKR